MDAVRTATAPMRVRQVTEYAMRAKEMDTGDAELRATVTVQVGVALHRIAAKGLIFRIGGEPCV